FSQSAASGGIIMRSRIRATLAVIAAAGAVSAGSVLTNAGTAEAHGRWARASLRGADGTRVGYVAFSGSHHWKHTDVTVHLRNASAVEAFHGMHIHANDAPANGD